MWFSSASCSSENGKLKTILNIPIYKDCASELESYLIKRSGDFKGTKYEFHYKVTFFDEVSLVHADLNGWVELKLKDNEFDNKVLVNTIKSICYPQASSAYSLSDISYAIEFIGDNQKNGILGNYIKLDKDVIEIHYNDKDD